MRRARCPLHEYPERAAFIAAGTVDVGGNAYRTGQMLVLTQGKPVVVTALTDATAMLLGGEPVGDRFLERDFVSSSKERIEQAKADWRAARMKLPDFDHDEFIPLPAQPATPPNPIS